MGTDIHGTFLKKNKETDQWEQLESTYDWDRNYLAFAILGNVRNGYGFAGCKTFDPVPTISDSKGIPNEYVVLDDDNVSTLIDFSEYADDNEPLWFGDHSLSHATMKELIEYDWEHTLTEYGVLTIEHYNETIKVGELPDSWCGDVGGNTVVIAPSPSEITEESTYVRCEWVTPLRRQVSHLYNAIIDLNDKYDEDIVMVFGFDS